MSHHPKEYNENLYYGLLIKGQLKEAIAYLSECGQTELFQKYFELFEYEKYIKFPVDDYLNEILLPYQIYYRDIFYLEIPAEQALNTLKRTLAKFFNIADENLEFSEIESIYVAKAFESRSYCFLGGKTGGHFGPYIWRTTELKSYDVELPNGKHKYAVKLLDGFVSKSWLDYVSFGALSTGGWSDGDGVINCIKTSYDFTDESFTVSLLKHEAQHASDIELYPEMSSADMKYREKLVELIYSTNRNLLEQFSYEADFAADSNGHALAANRIIEEFARLTDATLKEISIAETQSIARKLFARSNEEIKTKYAKNS